MTTEEELRKFIITCMKNVSEDHCLKDGKLIFVDPAHTFMVWREVPNIEEESVKTILKDLESEEGREVRIPKFDIGTEFKITIEFEWLSKEISEYRKNYSETNTGKYSDDSMFVFFYPSGERMFMGWVYNITRRDSEEFFTGNAVSVPMALVGFKQSDPLIFTWPFVKSVISVFNQGTCHVNPVLWMQSGNCGFAVAPYGYEDSIVEDMRKAIKGIVSKTGVIVRVDEFEVDE